MKRVSAVFLTIFLVFTISLMSISSAAPPALADHEKTNVTITVLKKLVPTYVYFTDVDTAKGGEIVVEMNNRDNGRFDRFCGPTVDITVPSTVTVGCDGKGPWSISIEITSISHSYSYTIRVNAI